MASYTEHLNLLKKDPVADGADTFNIETMLNENWDKVDFAVGNKADLENGKVKPSQIPNLNYETPLKDCDVKDNPVDADGLALSDSMQAGLTKRLLWSTVKSILSGIFVPQTRKVNNKDLSADITLSASDVGAAAASHGTHVSYSSTAPLMDGTASAGSAATVARSDHRHPVDTSRAAASHKHSAADINSGTLPPALGGTGVNSLAALAAALVGQGMSKVSVGSYTGTQSSFPTDNAADIPRTISLGFTPKAVVIITNDGTMNAPIYPGALVTFGGIAVTGNPLILKHTEYSNVYSLVAVEIVTNGFVTHHRSISAGNLKLRAVMNYASYSYTYAAFG